MIFSGAPLLAVLLATSPTGCDTELFRIARNKNANVVVYEVDAEAGREAPDRDPVRATWLMLAEDGRREDLNAFERALAYGFEVRRSPTGLRLVLKADASQEIEVREHHGCLRAFRRIAGHEAVLRLIRVEARESGLVPSVRSVEVFGTDPETGAALRERIAAPARARAQAGD